LKSRGGFEVEMTWRDGKIAEAKILSTLGGNCRVRSFIPLKVVKTDFKPAEGENPNRFFKIPEPPIFENATLVEGAILPDIFIQNGHVIDFTTEKGKWYTLVPK
jgi:alpha-L-fucosidase 2